MPHTAKLFRNGRSQAVRLPSDFRFPGSEVYVRRDPATGDVILSRRPESWQDFFDLAENHRMSPKTFWLIAEIRPHRSESCSDDRALSAGHQHGQLRHQGKLSSASGSVC